MTNVQTIDPREITAFCERLVAVLPDLVLIILDACERDPAFRKLCRDMSVEGGAGAGIEAVREMVEVSR
jgi:hypothetical protein